MVAPQLDGAPPPVRTVPAPDPSRRARRLGLVAALLMAVGGLGAGALPIPNPAFGLRLIGLPSRNVTLAIAVTYAGIVLMVLAWLWVAKMLRSRGAVAPAPTIAQLARTTATWAMPLALAPPLFSRDVYSYLAQSAELARGIDPYVFGPAGGLGIDDPLVRSIPTIWRDTPAPYGPLFLVVGRGITALTGNDVVLGIFAYRVLALAGLALIIWTLPRLARRCRMDVGLAMWLGVGNPLVLFHLVSGVHNEALMIGLTLAGMELGLRAGTRILDPHLLGGAFLIVCGSAVKLPALLVLGFLGLHWARLRGGRARDVAIAAGVLAAVTVVVYTPLSLGTGVGLGWTTTLAVPTLILSWMSVTTDLGLLGGQVGILGGLGDHTTAVLSLFRGVGLAIAALLCARLLWLVFRGRLDPITGMAAGLGAVVLLGPVVHPWYVLWGLIPLAATRSLPRYRRALLAASAVLAVVVPPTGADFNFRAFQLPLALAASLVMLAVLILVQRRRIQGATGVDIDALPGHAPVGRD
jgi:alpha-1,6-mannosyltransferase